MRSLPTCLFVALSMTVVLAQGTASARPLTFEDRLEAQESIERVYYSRQIGATRSFEEAVPRRVLETKVRTYLEESAALERIWRTPVTAEMLRREVARMVEQTQMPDRLRELFGALGNDPLLIQECLARPALVDRLARNFFAFDQSLHAASRRGAEALRQGLAEGRIDPRAGHPQRTVKEVGGARPDADDDAPGRAGIAEVGQIEEERERFLVRVPLERSEGSLRVATYSVAKEDWDAWWPRTRKDFAESIIEPVAPDWDPAVAAAIASEKVQTASGCLDDTWEGGLLDEIPDRLAPAVWTGSFMVIWGASLNPRDNKGWRYDPATDTWSQMSRINAPEGRFGHTAVWTGGRMIVWGGRGAAGVELNTGGQYDPIADTWSPTSTLNAPSARRGHLAVWTGSRMLVWGPETSWNGGRYDPPTDTWSPMSTTNTPDPVQGYTAVWSGGRMILWNGALSSLNRGGRYDPITNIWASMSTTNAPSRRNSWSAVSTGSQMIIWGGIDLTGELERLNTGGRYDPGTDIWMPTSTTNAPDGRSLHSGVWAGSEMMIWGGCTLAACPSVSGGRYSPETDTWTAVSTLNAPSTNVAAALWTGSQVLIWGAKQVGNVSNRIAGGRYHLATDSWTPISMGSAPLARYSHSAVWTGSHMVIWGGQGNETSTMTGGRYDPALATWSPTSTADAPPARSGHSVVWTGSRMIVWGGFTAGGATDSGGRYDPLVDSWAPTSMTGAPSARAGHSAVWTGSRMVVWGGGTNTGGRYDPETDAWSATSTTNAPTSRSQHTAVWTGSLMLIWGGYAPNSNVNTGGRYNPAGDSWSPMSTLGAPSARSGHGATWTGSYMLIWGGRNDLVTPSMGGLYDPASNSWIPTSPTQGRSEHTTVWTGSHMIAWGGMDGGFNDLDTGKRYVPGISTWGTTSVSDAPAGRSLHTAVWTGDRMIVWGGQSASGTLNTGASYCACSGGAVATYYQDADGDGYGIPSVAVPSCSPPAGYAASSGDCDDANAAIFPGATEICNRVDDNCSGTVDEGLSVDNDGDGFSCSGDCDDFAPAVHPGAAEICDQRDDDCDGFLPPDERDNDGDHFATCQGDCRDDLPGLHPGAPEGCDGIDTDCDGSIPAFEMDADGDGFRGCTGDCDDGNPARRPGAAELCNYTDDDCDGTVDEGTPDADGDGRMDCTDCRPLDPSTWASPPEATNLQVVLEQGDEICTWDDLYPAAGLSVLYDMFAGSLAALRQGGGDFSTGSCLASDLNFNAFDLSTIPPPPPGDGLYIIVRGRNPCGTGTYGSPHRDQSAAASPLACP
jgi:N-acetylneuraminic acid mutarotase